MPCVEVYELSIGYPYVERNLNSRVKARTRKTRKINISFIEFWCPVICPAVQRCNNENWSVLLTSQDNRSGVQRSRIISAKFSGHSCLAMREYYEDQFHTPL